MFPKQQSSIQYAMLFLSQMRSRVWSPEGGRLNGAKVPTISDNTYVNVCSYGVGAKVGSRHEDAASSHKGIIHQITLCHL